MYQVADHQGKDQSGGSGAEGYDNLDGRVIPDDLNLCRDFNIHVIFEVLDGLNMLDGLNVLDGLKVYNQLL